MSEKTGELEFSKELKFQTTTIPGLLIADLPVHGDARGWFKENWQNEKMSNLGLPEFGPIQNNISFNAEKGVTRGIHAEPWDKYISVGAGRIFGAWVDLRVGDSFGNVFTAELDPTKAIFVPRGVGNSFQALEDNTVYTYLVNEHWSAEAQSKYTFVNLADKTIDIKWPIPLDQASLSDKDKIHPGLANVIPMKPKRTLITGSNGQLGRALQIEFPDAEFTDSVELDITSKNLDSARPWRQYGTIINAAAFTAVDKAETPEDRPIAWEINARAVANLGKIATKYSITLIHISSDYVFDGTIDNHTEDEKFSPSGVYAEAKAAGDIAAAMAPKHYIMRTSWVIGEGNNFVRTMKSLAGRDIKPSVVNDQIGRLTFTSDLAKGIKHLITNKSPFGTYNLSGDGKPASWAEIAADVYELSGHGRDEITGVSTEEYYRGKEGIAPRPLQSTLNLDKIKSTGFQPADWQQSLAEYLKNEEAKK
ncbi:dTDP-4-dehydrorhamnose reductase [Candidatus Saccharibacteria bacterium CG11_big_fil_rev_8_21_14_0_20_41_19]|nr:sugar nucleotide-binding protein [Candidatus Saccharibacteria bacterium]OIP85449.1 MAG: dTDP-4-dehydrorhamnose reductase [Candidatus Saccharibacteria bacterium CG2_30_41_52]PIQ71228.1 MAG: dTDP-4-dehydrorhamnose reductase [Candidatus Saccharibacteria bacterium CG11_big_fil_rev_8_21_14_0_20_41_19]PIZ59825.1 MAG: dTDP-4-dehydrorhamnose reductase [Candidatus Saccharibacteria bacterium CG_4_10_14_0_2_um_filter_41_11]PJC29323.1 MAG: dTDP-4-dehydrorhamnose reductase [Candidatus Saccharibacteria ba